LESRGGSLLESAEENPAAVQAYRAARRHRDAGDLQKAVTSLEKLLQKHPDFYLGHIDLGMILAAQQENDRALEKAVRLEPNSINAQFQLGRAAFKLGDHDRAAPCFEQVVALDPKFNPMTYKTLASIYVNRQDPQGAARALESYLVHFPDAADAEKVKHILVKLSR
jgi:tetratricopeptide (TPR) repeat protein